MDNIDNGFNKVRFVVVRLISIIIFATLLSLIVELLLFTYTYLSIGNHK